KLANGSITAAKMTLNSITSGSLTSSSVTNEKIAPDAVTGEKVVESTLSQVPSAAKADFATASESANPIAFAHVNKEATLDTNLSKNIASVSQGSLSGIFCVEVSGFNPRGAQVTPQFEGAGNVNALVKIGGTADCPAPKVEVQTFEGTSRVKAGFYVAFYR
ncbi:MAG TPA: hypothetical protein VN758_14135, partial [Solirubrobacterales bacterium]|nr:hypothetical protein [Solirubrobacterales bacterium]